MEELKIFNYSHPLMETEWISLMGDKYRSSLPFKWSLARMMSEANVILWDGVVTMKNRETIKELFSQGKKLLVILGESQSLMRHNERIKLIHDLKHFDDIEINESNILDFSGSYLLPEEMIELLHECYKKLKDDKFKRV